MTDTNTCDECAADLEHGHELSNTTLCCACFQNAFVIVDGCVHQPCPENEHELTFDCPGFATQECKHCGLAAGSISDFHGHDLLPFSASQ
jgi:hypothetical protein